MLKDTDIETARRHVLLALDQTPRFRRLTDYVYAVGFSRAETITSAAKTASSGSGTPKGLFKFEPPKPASSQKCPRRRQVTRFSKLRLRTAVVDDTAAIHGNWLSRLTRVTNRQSESTTFPAGH